MSSGCATVTATDARFWNQIGPFGGWLAASLLDAVLGAAGTGWPVRSVQVHYLGAVRPGPLDIRVQCVRRQRTLALWEAGLWQDGAIAVRADAVLAATRDGPPGGPTADTGCPALPAPHTLPRWHGVDHLATFVRAFDYRLVEGAPFAAGPRAQTSGWLRLDAPTAFSGPARLLLLADAWFPALWSALDRPVPVTTVSLHVLFNPDAAWPEAAFDHPVAVHHRADAVGHGWGHEHGRLWWPDGRWAAQAQQLTWIDLNQPHRQAPAVPMRTTAPAPT